MSRTLARRFVVGLALAAVVSLWVFGSPRRAVAALARLADDPVAYGVALVVLYAVRPAFAWPTTLCAAAVGYGYGFVGFPLALVGAALTSVPPFLVVAHATTDGDGIADRAIGAAESYFGATGTVRGVVAARLAPIPADAVTAAAAASDVPLRRYLLGTLVGEIPWTAAAIAVGASADHLTTGGIDAVPPVIALAGAIGAGLLLAGPAYEWVATADRG
ncbi:TVP38/TMEM64 family protein [Halobacteriales archaeon SW_7_68_16]|nr:MAG: TVP38/TMEM64 family protein [Halobacteriales archaeon SW_7_68_16]